MLNRATVVAIAALALLSLVQPGCLADCTQSSNINAAVSAICIGVWPCQPLGETISVAEWIAPGGGLPGDTDLEPDDPDCFGEIDSSGYLHYQWKLGGIATGGDSRILYANLDSFAAQISGWTYMGIYDDVGTLAIWSKCDDVDDGVFDDDAIEVDSTLYIRERYEQVKQLRGDFTVQPIDGQGGQPIGPRSKVITVCPGTWVRFRTTGIVDTDRKVIRGINVTQSSSPAVDNWEVTMCGSTFDSSGNAGPTDCIVEMQMIPSGTFTNSVTIHDLPEDNTGEYIDGDFTDTAVVHVEDLHCEDQRIEDTGGSGGCDGCGGGGSVSVDMNSGDVEEPATGADAPKPLKVCGYRAVWPGGCLCYDFTYTQGTGWACNTDPSVELSASTDKRDYMLVSVVDGSGATTTYTYDFDPTASLETASISLADGTTYNFAVPVVPSYDPEDDNHTWRLLSITEPDGTVEQFGYDGGSFSPSWRVAADGEIRTIIEHGTGLAGELPTAVYTVDPASRAPGSQNPPTPDQYSRKTFVSYTYDTSGRLTSTTNSAGLKTTIAYTNGKASMVRVMNESAGASGEVYSQIGYTYGTASDLGDSEEYGTTTARRYKDVGTISTPGVADDDEDRRMVRYYYLSGSDNTFLRAVKRVWHDGGQQHQTTTRYSVETDPDNSLYGKVLSITDPQNHTTSYDYYDPDTLYDVSNPDVVPYPSTNGAVAGNGEIREVTVQGRRMVSYSYHVSGGMMKPFPTHTKDSLGYVVRAVVNSDGSLAETWQENESGVAEKVASYTYYVQADQQQHPHTLGMLKTETVERVASSGTDQERSLLVQHDYALDSLGRTVTTTVCPGTSAERSVVSRYDVLGQLRWAEDEQGRRTDCTYDYRGNLLTTTYPLVSGDSQRKYAESHYSDCCGRLEWTQDENEHRAWYAYDGYGRLREIRSALQGESEEPLVQHVFNDASFGEQTQVVIRSAAGVARTTSYQYDGRGRLKKIIHPFAYQEEDLLGSEEFIYDDGGRLILTMDGEGTKTAYRYDTFDRIEAIDYAYQGAFQYQDPLPSFAADVSYTYDGLTRQVTAVSGGSGWEHLGAGYTYDRQGRMKTYTPGLPSGYGTVAYEYNNLGEKTAMTVPLGAGDRGRRLIYRYDRSGRQLGMDVVPVTTPSDASLQVQSAQSPPTTLTYYDGSRRRVKLVSTTGDVYYFVYDPTAPFPAAVYEQGPTGRHLNIRTPSGSLISRDAFDADGVRMASRQFHFDGLGSTMDLSDADARLTDAYRYDAWGKTTSHTDPDPNDGVTMAADNPYQFVGQLGYYTHYQEPDLGLLQLGVRSYVPALSMFTSRDPVRDGANDYSYCAGNPALLIDPDGLIPLPPQAWQLLIGPYWNWFRFYFFGTGDERTLRDIGVSDFFWNCAQVSGAIKNFERLLPVSVAAHVAKRAPSACRGARGFVYLTLDKQSEANRVNLTLNPVLAPLGHTTFWMSASCRIMVTCCLRKYVYTCSMYHHMVDAFEDVDDVLYHIPGNQELPFGVAYPITDERRYKQHGTGQF